MPFGTEILSVERIMLKNGFSCHVNLAKAFEKRTEAHNLIDYLYCNREEGFPVSRRYQSALVIRDGKVSWILVSKGLAGP